MHNNAYIRQNEKLTKSRAPTLLFLCPHIIIRLILASTPNTHQL